MKLKELIGILERKKAYRHKLGKKFPAFNNGFIAFFANYGIQVEQDDDVRVINTGIYESTYNSITGTVTTFEKKDLHEDFNTIYRIVDEEKFKKNRNELYANMKAYNKLVNLDRRSFNAAKGTELTLGLVAAIFFFAVYVYYAVTTIMRYVNEKLPIEVTDYVVIGGVTVAAIALIIFLFIMRHKFYKNEKPLIQKYIRKR